METDISHRHLLEGLDHTEMRQTTRAATAQRQSHCAPGELPREATEVAALCQMTTLDR